MSDPIGRLTDLLYGTPECIAVWSPRATVQRMLDVEAALARACAAAGAIPSSAVGPIDTSCHVDGLDLEALSVAAASAGNLAIPLVKQLTARVKARDEHAARFVHWGATSQDIIDTATVLQIRDTFTLVRADLVRTSVALAARARAHRATLLVGRTWLKQALPITLGLKLAQSLDALGRHRARLDALAPRALVLQFGGAAGTLASLGERAPAIARHLADELALALPTLPWHTQRDRIAEVATTFGLLTGTLGKLARDLSLQMQTEVGELAEPPAEGKGGSSTMPHKRNPVGCAAVLTAATRVPGLVATLLAGMVQEHERALGGWQAEWDALPDIARLTCGALAQTWRLVEGFEVDEARLAANLDLTHGLILGEAVVLALGDALGRLEAHHLVAQASKRAVESRQTLFDVLSADKQVTRHLSIERLNALLDPINYVGQATHFVDAVLAAHDADQER